MNDVRLPRVAFVVDLQLFLKTPHDEMVQGIVPS